MDNYGYVFGENKHTTNTTVYCQYIITDAVMIFPAPLIAHCQFEDNFCGWKSFSREGEGGWKLSPKSLDPKGKSTAWLAPVGGCCISEY